MNTEKSDWEHIAFPFFNDFPRADIFLLALHGIGGEDGRLQGFLDLVQQPYTGSGMVPSSLAMDKILAKQIYGFYNIPTPRYRVLEANRDCADLAEGVEREFKIPVVIKNPLGGSSLGMGIARSQEQLRALLSELGKGSDKLLVEEFISGAEASCGFVEEGPVLPPTELRPIKDSFFSYKAKYEKGFTEEITPAAFDQDIMQQMQSLSAKCHKALGLSVYSRTDFLIVKNQIWVLETNNLPGFTPMSLLPQQALSVGLSYSNLLSHIIELSLKKRMFRTP